MVYLGAMLKHSGLMLSVLNLMASGSPLRILRSYATVQTPSPFGVILQRVLIAPLILEWP